MADFSAHVTQLLNSQAVATALGVASKTGLLKALPPEPSTAQEIAERAGLSQRYVTEILAVLVCGKVVDLTDEQPPRFALPRERKEALAGMGIYFEELPLLSQCAFEEVSRAAKSGDGVAPSCYGRFSEWMGRLADAKHERLLVERFLPALCSGSKIKWGGMASSRLVCDLGCGRGTAALLIAQAFPSVRVVGLDIDVAGIEAAQARAAQLGIENVSYHVADATKLASTGVDGVELLGKCDLVTAFDSIHDLSNPGGALDGARALLKPADGLFAMVDIRAKTRLSDNVAHPMAPFLYTVSLMHCMPQVCQMPFTAPTKHYDTCKRTQPRFAVSKEHGKRARSHLKQPEGTERLQQALNRALLTA